MAQTVSLASLHLDPYEGCKSCHLQDTWVVGCGIVEMWFGYSSLVNEIYGAPIERYAAEVQILDRTTLLPANIL